MALALAGRAQEGSAVAPEPVTVRLVSPGEGEPAVDRVAVEVAVEGPPAAGLRVVELEVDGALVHWWERPPYEVVHDFGMSGRGHRVVVRVLEASGLVAETSSVTTPVRIDERVDLELQQIYATVVDRQGRRVPDLSAEDFAIRDRDLPQEVVTFGVGEIPFTGIVLVDSSLSMEGRRLRGALAAARRFAQGMRTLDRVQMLAFSDRLQHATPVGTGEIIQAALREPVTAAGGTAVRDHLLMAVRLLEKRQGRRAIVLLTDGWDQVSVVAGSDLGGAVRRSQSVIYWVRLVGDEPTSFHMRGGFGAAVGGFFAIRYNPAPTSWADETKARQDYRDLEDLVAATGGRVVVADTIAGLEDAVADVLDELHGQYALGYYPTAEAAGPGWHPVSVKLERRGLKVRVREGYVDR